MAVVLPLPFSRDFRRDRSTVTTTFESHLKQAANAPLNFAITFPAEFPQLFGVKTRPSARRSSASAPNAAHDQSKNPTGAALCPLPDCPSFANRNCGLAGQNECARREHHFVRIAVVPAPAAKEQRSLTVLHEAIGVFAAGADRLLRAGRSSRGNRAAEQRTRTSPPKITQRKHDVPFHQAKEKNGERAAARRRISRENLSTCLARIIHKRHQ